MEMLTRVGFVGLESLEEAEAGKRGLVVTATDSMRLDGIPRGANFRARQGGGPEPWMECGESQESVMSKKHKEGSVSRMRERDDAKKPGLLASPGRSWLTLP